MKYSRMRIRVRLISHAISYVFSCTCRIIDVWPLLHRVGFSRDLALPVWDFEGLI